MDFDKPEVYLHDTSITDGLVDITSHFILFWDKLQELPSTHSFDAAAVAYHAEHLQAVIVCKPC